MSVLSVIFRFAIRLVQHPAVKHVMTVIVREATAATIREIQKHSRHIQASLKIS